MTATTILPDNTKLEVKVPEGENESTDNKSIFRPGIPDLKTLRETAKNYLKTMKTDRMEGTVTTFGVPFVRKCDLVLIKDEDGKAAMKKFYGRSSGSNKMDLSRAANIRTEVNLIGKNSDDAIAALDKYLDDAYMAHLNNVRVVHGKGAGILRQAVHAHLKSVPYVKSFKLGEFGEGDAGVTIVTFIK